ncbi:hypothetical protein Gotri_012956 [Gossypium trilobum]|uniref:SKP1-like protein 21 n=1 Tax=Gossypium trilobum TaxID=34281 RepID=A0A7J9DRY0_9ROSI|nr:hypothetical protein [Gossypium trilobum]
MYMILSLPGTDILTPWAFSKHLEYTWTRAAILTQFVQAGSESSPCELDQRTPLLSSHGSLCTQSFGGTYSGHSNATSPKNMGHGDHVVDQVARSLYVGYRNNATMDPAWFAAVETICMLNGCAMIHEALDTQIMKSYIWLQTVDGSIQQVEQEIAMFCPMICHEVIQKGMGSSKNYAISLPQQVNPAVLSLILDYCRFHQVPGRSNKERKSFDEKFIRMDTKRLCELTSAADSLQLKPLVDLTSRALARIIEGKAPEEIREIFHLPDDLTEEEKLEPLKNATDDPRIRLLNRLYAKKRKELKEREKLKNVEVDEELVDDRSVDDLLSFINGDDGDSKGIKTSKSKRKNRRRKDLLKSTSAHEATKNHNKESNGLNSVCRSAEVGQILPGVDATTNLQDVEDDIFPNKNEFDDGDIDDEIDPTLKEKIDREVEDFARRLNSDWPERMQEILSLGQEKKPVHLSLNGKGS